MAQVVLLMLLLVVALAILVLLGAWAAGLWPSGRAPDRDLVERLREDRWGDGREAADEIMRLRTELEQRGADIGGV